MLRGIAAALVAAAAAVATPAAVAADLIIYDEQVYYDPAPATTWTGGYVGGWIGFRAGNITNTACVGLCDTNIPLNGLTAGVTAGYDYQFDANWVIGGFLTIPLLRPTTTFNSVQFPGVTWTVSPNFAAVAGARLGYATGNFMPYMLIGAAVANVTVTPAGGPPNPSTATHVGGVIGGGIEAKLDDHWSVDGRYMLGILGDGTYNFGGGNSSYSELSHNLSIGVNYRF